MGKLISSCFDDINKPTLPPQNLFCHPGLRKGGVSIINDCGGGRLGSAARSTCSTRKRKSNKIGIFRAGTIHYCHLFIIAIWP